MGHTYLGYAREKRAFFSLMWEDRGDMVLGRQRCGIAASYFYSVRVASLIYLQIIGKKSD